MRAPGAAGAAVGEAGEDTVVSGTQRMGRQGRPGGAGKTLIVRDPARQGRLPSRALWLSWRVPLLAHRALP